MKRALLREVFADDPSMLAVIEQEEQTRLLQQLLMAATTKEKLEIARGVELLKGEKGDEPSDERLVALIEPLIPDPIPGKDGKDGIDGHTPTKEELLAIIEPLIPEVEDGKPGKDGTSVTAQDVLDLILSLEGEQAANFGKALGAKIDISQIRNAGSFIYKGTRYRFEELMHGAGSGGGSSTGMTLTPETPTGVVDDSNVTFTVANEPLYITVNGASYKVGQGTYLSYSGGTITLSSAVGTGGFIQSWYNASGTQELTAESPTGTVDDSNVTFTVSNEPLYIVVNGAQYRVGQGTYVSYVAGTITLSSPVGSGGFIESYYNS